MPMITQLPESNIPFSTRIDRFYACQDAGCSPEELSTDIEVALSVAPSPEHAAMARDVRDLLFS